MRSERNFTAPSPNPKLQPPGCILAHACRVQLGSELGLGHFVFIGRSPRPTVRASVLPFTRPIHVPPVTLCHISRSPNEMVLLVPSMTAAMFTFVSVTRLVAVSLLYVLAIWWLIK